MRPKYCILCGHGLGSREVEGQTIPKCPSCGYEHWENPAPVATALLVRGKKIVLVKSKTRKVWGLPSGYVEKGEKAEEALLREIKEETNLDATVVKPLGTFPIDAKRKNILLMAYEAVATGGELAGDGEEISELDEFGPESALKLLTEKEERTILSGWLKERAKSS